MMKSALALSAVLASVAVNAQTIGDWGRATYMGGGMMGGTTTGSILGTIFFVGLTLLVWLWVIKLWKDIRRKK